MISFYRVLVLTDHIVHSDQNSIYAILSQLLQHPKTQLIDIASRGIEENNTFFNGAQISELFGTRINQKFQYSDTAEHYKVNLKKLNLSDYDIVMMRLPRPTSDEFLFNIQKIFNNAIIINSPSGIVKTSNKKYLLNFPELCPDIRLCQSLDDIYNEIQKHDIILKPLKEYGGKGLLKITSDILNDGVRNYNTLAYLENMKEWIESNGFLSMRYLKNVSQGDKRILVAGGKILAASLRLPPEGSWLCNVAQGGTSVAADVTIEEELIIKALNPYLEKEGILIYGADTLVNDDGKRILSEINTLSIGGFPQAEAQTGKPVIKILIEKIFEYADEWTRKYPKHQSN